MPCGFRPRYGGGARRSPTRPRFEGEAGGFRGVTGANQSAALRRGRKEAVRPMHVTVAGKQIDVGDALRSRVMDALEAAVGKYFGNAIEAQVTFSRDGSAFYRADTAVHVGRGLPTIASAQCRENG